MSLQHSVEIISEKPALLWRCSHRRRFVAGGDAAAATMPLSSKNDSSWRLAGFPW
jgi:hypothetical protein